MTKHEQICSEEHDNTFIKNADWLKSVGGNLATRLDRTLSNKLTGCLYLNLQCILLLELAGLDFAID